MAIQECGNGHLYDTDQYASCPYCQGGGNRINFGAGAANFGTPNFGVPDMSSDIGKTVGAGMQFPSAPAPVMPVQPEIPVESVQDEIGATVPPSSYRSSRKETDTGKTVAVFQKKNQFEPVVGWLVCVEGPDKGKDFKFYAKNNTIGRNEKNDICIKGDPTISRENHAKIAYDDKHNSYYIMPGEGSNTIYLNDDPVFIPATLQSYDVLELGESKYLVITLCNKKFNWDTGIDTGLDI